MAFRYRSRRPTGRAIANLLDGQTYTFRRTNELTLSTDLFTSCRLEGGRRASGLEVGLDGDHF